MQKFVKGLIVLVVTWVLIDLGINNLYFSSFFKIDRELISDGHKYIDQFLRDLNFIKMHNPFGMDTKLSDAGSVLNPVVSFYVFPHRDPPTEGYLGISKKIWTKTGSENWMTNITTEELKSLNFHWMESLHNFDHWNIFKSKPFLTYLDSKDKTAFEIIELIALPLVPDVMGLMQAARLYLLREIQGPNSLKALENYRKLAKFLFYSGELSGAMISLGMLRDENRIIEKTKFSSDQWKRVDKDLIDKLRRVVYTWAAFLSPILINKYYPRLKEHLETVSPTYCAGNFQALVQYAIGFHFSSEKLPFGRSLHSFGSRIFFEYTSGKCGQSALLEKILAKPESDWFFLYSRSTIGGILFKESQGDFFKLYRTSGN